MDVQVDDIDVGREQVMALGDGGPASGTTTTRGWFWSLQDPEGNEFRLVQYYD